MGCGCDGEKSERKRSNLPDVSGRWQFETSGLWDTLRDGQVTHANLEVPNSARLTLRLEQNERFAIAHVEELVLDGIKVELEAQPRKLGALYAVGREWLLHLVDTEDSGFFECRFDRRDRRPSELSLLYRELGPNFAQQDPLRKAVVALGTGKRLE